MDGVDVALLETDGESVQSFGAALEVPYTPIQRRQIERALEDAKTIIMRDERPGALADVENMVTQAHAKAVSQFLAANGLKESEIDVLGFHGQTVLHRPETALTVQLGDGEALAKATGIDTVFDFRAADMKAGGQGAPLVPVFHAALAADIPDRPLAFVNIGGIANISWVGENGDLVAFDTGPGNALIDRWVQASAGVPFDQGGAIASEGGIVMEVLERYMASPYFAAKAPKSLDRLDFAPLEPGSVGLHDGARTLARVTAQAIYAAVDHLPEPPKQWIVCGGGARNAIIVSDLAELAASDEATVLVAEEHGLNGDMLEAQAFAYLAVRSLKGLPLTYPTTTGCKHPTIGGVLARHGP